MKVQKLFVAQLTLALATTVLAGNILAHECESTWVGGVDLPNRFLFLVAHTNSVAVDSTGVLYFADGKQSPVAIEVCTADRVRMVLQADGTSYVIDGRVNMDELTGTFFPQENEAATFPFRMVKMRRISMENLEAREGTYVFKNGSRLKVRAVFPGYLRSYAPDQGSFHNLYPTSEREFLQAADLAHPDDQVKIRFGKGILEHAIKGRAHRVKDQPGALSLMKDDESAFVELLKERRIHFLRVRAGTFGMGSPMSTQDAEALFKFDERTIKGLEYPPRQTHITRDYWLGRSEVTNAQFRVFADQAAYITTAELEGSGLLWIDGEFKRVPGASWRNPGREIRPNEPVVMVSWYDANAFCQWLSLRTGREFRLPTEAEWEYASRAGNNAYYGHGGGPDDLEAYAWFSANAEGKPRDVETRAPSVWGFYDMHGNVWEWCADWYAMIDPTAHAVDPGGPKTGDERVIRGGSWINGRFDCRSSYRAHDDPGLAEPHFGFRVGTTLRAE